MTPSPISILYLLLPTLLRAQSPSPSSFVASFPFSPLPLKIPFAEHATITISPIPSSSSSLLVEFIANTPDSTLRKHGPPNILLSVSNSSDESPFIVTSGTARDLNESAVKNYDCIRENPCFKHPEFFDRQAFFTRASRAFVHLDIAQTEQRVYVTVRNYDRGFWLQGGPVSPNLEGELRLSVAEQPLCAGYLKGADSDHCYGRGNCTKGECDCQDSFEGRLCETEVMELGKKLPEVEEPEEGWLVDPLEEWGYTVEVAAFKKSVLSTKVNAADTARVIVYAVVLKGHVPQMESLPMNVDTTVSMWSKEKDDQDGGQFLDEEPPLPGVYHTKRACNEPKSSAYRTLELICHLGKVKTGTVVQIGFAANATGSTSQDPQSVVIRFQVDYCGGDKLPSCLTRALIPWTVLPVMVSIIALTGLAIMFMLWLDRRHDFTSPIDRLTDKELDRMYPSRKFCLRERLNEGEREKECQICLCTFEPDDIVRNLRCEHTYHSACLDPWLTMNNASCPTCRANVRLAHLSDKRRLRWVITFCLWPVVRVRRGRERITAEAAQRAASPSEALETEMDVEAGQSTSVRPDTGSRGTADSQAAESGLGQTEVSFSSTGAIRINGSESQSSTTQSQLQQQGTSSVALNSMGVVVASADQTLTKQAKSEQQGPTGEASANPEAENGVIGTPVTSNLTNVDPQKTDERITTIRQRPET